MLREDNEWCSNEEEFSAIIQRFYQNLFTSTSPAVEKIEELLASTRSVQAIQNIFSLYSQCSGQMINFNKSILFFSPNTIDEIRSIFIAGLNMQTTEVLKARYFTNSGFLDSREGNYPYLTWRSICWGKHLLIQDLRRRIGNGQNTNAFRDPWIPRPPSFLPIMKGLNEELKVSELIQQPGKWNRDLIQQLYLIPDSQIILSVPLSPFDHEDSWLWHYNKNVSFSVRSGYKLALSVDRSSPSSSSEVLSAWWKAFWAIQIPKKILIFGWKGFHEILPTIKGLHRRNVSTHSNCPLCGYGEDSNAHAVFWCPFAQEVWVLFEYQFMVGHKEDISFKDVLFYNTELLEKELFDKMLIIAWGVWTERNKRTHGEAYRTTHQVKIWLTAYQVEIKSVNAKGRVLTGEALTHINQMEVGFQELTLCVDVAISTETEMIGLGAVIFAANKKVQASLAKPMEGSLLVFHAEALTLLVGLHWAQTIGLSIKIILSDSLSLVQALDNSNVYQNELASLPLQRKHVQHVLLEGPSKINLVPFYTHRGVSLQSCLLFPVTVLTLGFYVITPCICKIAGNTVQEARKVFLFGGFVPLVMVLSWNLIVLVLTEPSQASISKDPISLMLSVNPSAL
ncbi:hypothetical protein POM88_054767 [Heracleum sosnowskyi]|uniref:Reverse transcriptase zinc-binding domain-containing protein n=1 Tax=Heracleum sosnowskyi TaxID=360622 RepID=A0AAD8GN24_9APIA|nr:hypothetical protein POM88_054767 [Heracleum sosnowskyi]